MLWRWSCWAGGRCVGGVLAAKSGGGGFSWAAVVFLERARRFGDVRVCRIFAVRVLSVVTLRVLRCEGIWCGGGFEVV